MSAPKTGPSQIPLFPAQTTIKRNIVLADYAEHWLATASAPPFVTAYTQKVRTAQARAYVVPYLGHLEVRRLELVHMAWLQAELWKRISQTTVLSVFRSVVSPMLHQAARDKLLPVAPTKNMRWPRKEFPRPDPFDDDERERILAYYAAHRPEWYLLVALVFLAGMRPAEAAGLRWGDIDLEAGTASIRRGMVDGAEAAPKTARSARTIGLNSRLLAALRSEGFSRDPGALVVTDGGGPVVTHRWGHWHFRPVLDRLGIRQRGFYHGRHSYISAAALAGAPLPKIAAYCGTSVARIERHYLRWLGSMDDPLSHRGRA